LGADRLARLRGQPLGLLDQRRDQPPALRGQIPQPVPVQRLLCLTQRGAELQQLTHLGQCLTDEQVHQPRAHGGPAQLPDLGGETGVPGGARLGGPLVADGRERGRGVCVQLVRYLRQVGRLHRGR
jgi:hypothetical protein